MSRKPSYAACYAQAVAVHAAADQVIKFLEAESFPALKHWPDLTKPPPLIFPDGSVYNPTTKEFM